MSRAHYLLSHVLAGWSSSLLEVDRRCSVFAWLAFGVPVRGSLPRWPLVSLLGALAFGGLGAADRQPRPDDRGGVGADEPGDAADVGAVGRVLLLGELPGGVQPFIQALPLTALNDALRGVVNEGQPLAAVAGELAIMAGWGSACFALALRLFRWR